MQARWKQFFVTRSNPCKELRRCERRYLALPEITDISGIKKNSKNKFSKLSLFLVHRILYSSKESNQLFTFFQDVESNIP